MYALCHVVLYKLKLRDHRRQRLLRLTMILYTSK